MRTSRFMISTVLALAAAAMSGCGDDEAAPPAAGGGGNGTTEPMAAASVEVSSSELGDILVDPEGRTLYVFLNDADGDSTCYDDCEANWPPLVAEGEPVAGDGVDASLLGTTEREDGSSQVTYDGQPLYLFAGDDAAGDLNGQGVGDVWFVVGPGGEPIEKGMEAAAKY